MAAAKPWWYRKAPASRRPGTSGRAEVPVAWGLVVPRIYATIGRAPGNHVVLDHPTVSNHHARLSWSGGGLLVEDLSSANGTFVDGERVKAARTRPGAELVIGEVVLPWSHEGLRQLLKAGVGARTLVIPAQRSPSFVCASCGHVGALPPGPIPSKFKCPQCHDTMRTRTKPKGSGAGAIASGFALSLVAAATGGFVYVTVFKKTTPLPLVAGTQAEAAPAATPEEALENAARATAVKLVAAIDPMDPITRNTAVKLAARTEGPFHVEQVAEIWGAVREKWRYVNDPEGREYFATAKETIENGYVGDCDDFAITLVSMVTAIGGKARVVLMDGPRGGHAYAEACVQGEPSKVASTLFKHYKSRFKRYLTAGMPKEIAFRSSSECPIWLNLDWNSAVPGGPYEPERWATAVYEGGQVEMLTPANPAPANDAKPAADAKPLSSGTHASTPD